MTLLEAVLNEASKRRFIEPFYSNGIADKYRNGGIEIPDLEDLVKFYDTHNDATSRIDWNRRKDGDFFEDLIYSMQNYSSKSTKRSKVSQLFDRPDCQIIYENDEFAFVNPQSWEAGKFMDSFECGGQGAKWCIGYERTDQYWDSYNKHSAFCLIYRKGDADENDRKYMVQFEQLNGFDRPKVLIWNQPDNNIGKSIEGVSEDFLLSTIYPLARKVDEEWHHDKYYLQGAYVESEYSGTLSELADKILHTSGKRAVKLSKPFVDEPECFITITEEKLTSSSLEEFKDTIGNALDHVDVTYAFTGDLILDKKSSILKNRYSHFEPKSIYVDTLQLKTIFNIANDFPGAGFYHCGCIYIKLPKSYSIGISKDTIVRQILGLPKALSPIYAVPNTSVIESGNYKDGAKSPNKIKVTVEDIDTGIIFYNATLSVAGIPTDKLYDLKSVNCTIVDR